MKSFDYVHFFKKYRLKIMALALCLLLLILPRIWRAIALRAETQKSLTPIVSVFVATPSVVEETLTLPGTLYAWHEAPIYARTSGYVKKWHVDIGARVAMNQALAEIETPEIDAQLREAEAALTAEQARSSLAKITAVRWRSLVRPNFVSKQATDEKIYAADVLKASVKASTAQVERLRELVGFEKVIAPFAGVITARNVDIGMLINAGNNSEKKPLFRIAQTNPLRLYVKIPQNDVVHVQHADFISFSIAGHPKKRFKATLLNTSDAIDPETRTLLAQFVVVNEDDLLLPGSYVQVDIVTSAKDIFRVPINALLFQAAGIQLALLDNQNHVVLRTVTLGRDFGNEVEVTAGLCKGERIILNPPDAINSGDIVRPALLNLS